MKISPRVRKMVCDRFSMKEVMKQLYDLDVEDGKKLSCPFPDHGGPDKDPSAVYYEQTNVIHCFRESRRYDVVDALLVAGVPERKIIGLVLDNSAPQGSKRQKRTKGRGLSECKKIFQDTVQGTIKEMRRGRRQWKECWPDIDEYLQRVNSEEG